jgi:predicted membrane protein
MEHNHAQKRFLIGFVILAAGLALLLRNFGILDYELKRYILRWEVILIALGFVFILSHDNKGPGIVLLFVGGAFYLSDFFDFHFNFWQVFLPALLILAGILILFRQKLEITGDSEKKNIDNEDFIDEVNVFGGGDRNIVSQNFQGGKILAIFGGSNFNMMRAKLAPGKNYIEVLAVFGGMKLVVPEDWNVRINVVSIFGGFSDKHRIRPIESLEKNDTELVLKGFVLFGGGEIKSF